MADKYLKQDENGCYSVNFKPDYPIIDCHIHMSNILPGKQVPINQDAPKPKYFTLPPQSALDLSVPYWTREDYLIEKYTSPLALVAYCKEGYKIFKDMLHGTYAHYEQSAQSNGIVHSIMLPISTARSDQSPNAITNANSHSELSPFMSVHPLDQNAIQKISHYKSLGAVGLKLKITASEVAKHYTALLALMKHCHHLNLPVLFHTGTVVSNQTGISKLNKKLLNSTHVDMLLRLLKDMPNDFIFIFGHAGIQSYKEVAELMKQYPATYAELSSQSAESIAYLIHHVGAERLLFGSDWPALPQAFTLSGILHATEDNSSARKQILYKNAQALFNIDLGGII